MPYSSRTHTVVTIAAIGCIVSACGGGSGSPSDAAPPVASNSSATTTNNTNSTNSGVNNNRLAAATVAAKNAANTDPMCTTDKLGDFYWEIGNASDNAPIVYSSQGTGSVNSSSYFNIASASKWIFGAYVLEKKGIDQVRGISALKDGLRFMSGYTGFNEDACIGKQNVTACYIAGMNGKTGQANPDTVNKFDYDSGHDQKLANVDLGLGNFTAAQLDAEYQNTIGLSTGFHMAALDPLMAGGMMGTATDYALFLKKIMKQDLEIGRYLGDQAVCALPSACPGKVVYSPILLLNEPWTYSYNHWVESEKGNGSIDAYSSPGKWGFYPWISADKKYYGILSRHDKEIGAYGASVKCGRQIRKAFMNAL
ncbi:hypothetical protein [Undibacterium umbellatum]|uniref:Beta-lactamase-related domain-containing protein n=1 Tax=Undibacterium umbellatum TaxID=2762300 RepID=A0ABR6ZA17_9BURK|nr:hypothetical protein [Undibacterium umbellatum]MBC3908601.1 hypothetical protein [Undibacterium umbellatum]